MRGLLIDLKTDARRIRRAVFEGEYPRQESNLRLLAPEASALSTELRGQALNARDKDSGGHCKCQFLMQPRLATKEKRPTNQRRTLSTQ